VKRAAACAALIAALAGALTVFALGPGRERSPLLSAPIDFLAFYCGGRVALSGADPYRAEPLRACEDATYRAASGNVAYPNLAVPAPLPPYALAFYGAFAALPFGAANALWLFVCLAAAAACVVLLRAVAPLPLALVVAALAGALVLPASVIGQPTPLLACAMLASAVALRGNRPQLAAAFLAPALIEPHVALPALAALFVWERRARLPIAAIVAACACVSLAAGGFARNAEYVFSVLPAHARADGLEFGGQYSLSALLAFAGVAPTAALAWGAASYLAAVGTGIAVAGRLAAVLRERAALVLTAPAFALIGGVHIHSHQMALALPLLALLLARRRGNAVLLWCALLCLAIPWEFLCAFGPVVKFFGTLPHADAAAQLARVADGRRLAEDAWGVWVRSGVRDGRPPLERLLFKLPTWFALLALAGTALALGASPARRAALAPVRGGA
jgi:hypothetical protein